MPHPPILAWVQILKSVEMERKREHTKIDSKFSVSQSSEESSSDDGIRHSKERKRRRHSSEVKKKKSKSSKTKILREKVKEKITDEDYFIRSTEFRMWLSEEKSIFFSDLDSAQSRKLFRKFVRRWNSGKLKKKYYSGIQSSSLRHSSQTDYKWKVSSEDKDKLSSVCDQVSSWTSASSFKHEQEPSSSVIGPRVIGPVMKPAKRDPYKEEEEFEKQREHLKKERREYRKYNEMVMDEILPKATGFAAKIEKKRARVEARREREISPDFNESTLMGGATSDIKAKLMTEQKQREHRAQAASQKIIDYQAKEKARVAAILEQARANKKEGSLW